MRIYSREQQLPLRGRGFEFICPQCKANYANEGLLGKYNVQCPNCATTWRVNSQGKPLTVEEVNE